MKQEKHWRWLKTREKSLILEHRFCRGDTVADTADALCCSERTVQRHTARFFAGTLFMDTQVIRRRVVLEAAHLIALEVAIRVDCCFNLFEFKALLILAFGEECDVHICTIQRALKRMGYTYKRTTRIPRQSCPITCRFFLLWFAAQQYRDCDVFFLDEAGFNHVLFNRDYGWAKRGERTISRQDTIKDTRYTVISTGNCDGLFDYCVFDGTCDQFKLIAYVFFHLFPRLPRNAVLILDNASCHRTRLVQLIAEFVGLPLIGLPPYSPQLNLAELFFALLKKHLQKYRGLSCFRVDNALHLLCDNMMNMKINYRVKLE